MPKTTKIKENDIRVATFRDASVALIEAAQKWLRVAREAKEDTNISLATPAEIFYVGGIAAMIPATVRDIPHRIKIQTE